MNESFDILQGQASFVALQSPDWSCQFALRDKYRTDDIILIEQRDKQDLLEMVYRKSAVMLQL